MIQEKIAEQLKEINPDVEEKVIEVIVEREIGKRSQALVQALDRLYDMELNFKKIRPDQLTYHLDGSLKSEGYSKNKLDEYNKASQAIDKLKKAIDKGLAGDMQDVNKLNGQGGNQQTDS